MDTNSPDKQIQITGKKKISSWILGIISMGLSILGSFIITGITDYLSIQEILTMSEADRIGKISTAIYYGLVLIFSIFGFIKGITELKMSKKRLAIKGMIVCFLSVAVLLYMVYLSLAFYAL